MWGRQEGHLHLHLDLHHHLLLALETRGTAAVKLCADASFSNLRVSYKDLERWIRHLDVNCPSLSTSRPQRPSHRPSREIHRSCHASPDNHRRSRYSRSRCRRVGTQLSHQLQSLTSSPSGLSRQGHKVRVLERKTTWEETGSGIQLQPNVSRILEEWGMLEEVKKVAHDNEQAALRDHRLGLVAYHDFTKRGPAWSASL
jgi:hypothetical protein